MSRWSCVLFDLDGTLVDSAPGILGSVEFAYRDAGIEPPDRAALRAWLGPPMWENLTVRGGLDDAAASAVFERFKARYDGAGVYEAEPMPGVLALLDALGDAGVPLAVATSKRDEPARLLLAHLGIAGRFLAIRGATPESATKEDAIRGALAGLEAAGADTSTAVILGDRHHDVDGAAATGIDSVFAAWGYGGPVEATGATATAATPAEFARLLLD